MNIPQHTAKNPTLHERFFIMLLLATIPTVFGCGVLPAGQGSTRNLTVTGFTSPVAMAYSTATSVQAIVPGIAISETGATGFIQRLIMQAVYDVLENQACSAFLSDAVISTTLNQLINSYLRTIDVLKRSSNVIDPDKRSQKGVFGETSATSNQEIPSAERNDNRSRKAINLVRFERLMSVLLDQTADKEPRGIIPLQNVGVRRVDSPSRPFMFEIFSLCEQGRIKACKTEQTGKMVEGRHCVFRICASNMDDLNAWMEAIAGAVNVYPTRLHSVH
ncbi:Sec7 domain [Parelaphostrongylus tenuis]|uniref:Sec7 domain n=1 Tax=Parelaphostrongylus tenuis TaxID=148309 RepID=A0AAD5MAN7_PARTN|nr:Sec7 domain [Parelaphostrongylus tenuis]